MDVLFFLGTGRCGSSLLHEVFARHPDVGFISNVDDRLAFLGLTGRWNSAVYKHIPPQWTQKGSLRFAPSEGYRIFDREVSRAISKTHRDLTEDDAFPWLAERMAHAIGRRARAQRCELFAHKFTGWPRARFLGKVYRDAKFIHVVRDGRAVANSYLKMPWWTGVNGPDSWSLGPLGPEYEAEWETTGRSLVGLAGLAWKILIDAFEAAESQLPAANWITIRYEDAVRNPREEFERMLEFAGLDWNAEFDRGFGRHHFHRDRCSSFQTDLGPHNVALLDSLLGDYLERYAYAH